MFCEVPDFVLEHGGPRKLDELFDAGFFDYRGTKVGQARVMRCRPKFPEWSVTVELTYIPEVLPREAVLGALETAGLPLDTPVAGLIEHHRNNAVQAAALGVFATR